MPELVSLRTERGSTPTRGGRIDPEPAVLEPVFVSAAGHRRRAARIATIAFLGLATLWVVAVIAGIVGFRPLPEIPLVADPPSGEAATPEAAAEDRAKARAGNPSGDRSDGERRSAGNERAGGSGETRGDRDDGTQASPEAPTSTAPAPTEAPGSSGDHAATDPAPAPPSGRETGQPDSPGKSDLAPGRTQAGNQTS